jgi:hypothetical protein
MYVDPNQFLYQLREKGDWRFECEIELVTASRLADIPGSMNELFFEVTQEEDGGFCAECLSENIFTQGDDWDAVRRNVQEAVRAYFFD